jgi:hypothetical protein
VSCDWVHACSGTISGTSDNAAPLRAFSQSAFVEEDAAAPGTAAGRRRLAGTMGTLVRFGAMGCIMPPASASQKREKRSMTRRLTARVSNSPNIWLSWAETG